MHDLTTRPEAGSAKPVMAPQARVRVDWHCGKPMRMSQHLHGGWRVRLECQVNGCGCVRQMSAQMLEDNKFQEMTT